MKQEELCERVKVQCELESAMKLAKTAAVMKNQFLANMSREVGICVRQQESIFFDTYCFMLHRREHH